MDVAIIGGLGYLGYNLARYHISQGDNVYIFCRWKSIHKRRILTSKILDTGSTIIARDRLYPKYFKNILNKININIAYLSTGKIFGNLKDIIEANIYIPYVWAKYISYYTSGIPVYISHAFSKMRLKEKVFNDVIIYSDGKTIDYDGLLMTLKNFIDSKIICEDILLKNINRILIIKPGILVGSHAYHPEWKLIKTFSRLGIEIRSNVYIPFTYIKDIGKLIRHLTPIINSKTNIKVYLLAVSWTDTITNINRWIMKKYNVKPILRINIDPLIKLIRKLYPNIWANIILNPNKIVYLYPLNLKSYGFDKWTEMDVALQSIILD